MTWLGYGPSRAASGTDMPSSTQRWAAAATASISASRASDDEVGIGVAEAVIAHRDHLLPEVDHCGVGDHPGRRRGLDCFELLRSIGEQGNRIVLQRLPPSHQVLATHVVPPYLALGKRAFPNV